MMIIDLVNTTTDKIEDALTALRRRLGGPASGKVLTLVIVTDEAGQYDALRAAAEASRENPCRILAVIPREIAEETRLDAELRLGDGAPGETVLLRLYGELAQHADAAILPLLLPDTPVVTWWPGPPPPRPADDPLGALAQRRITDAAADPDPPAALERLGEAYRPGDTDLSWTRITPWRSLLASALDQTHEDVTAAEIRAEPRNPSAILLGAWLATRLCVRCVLSSGPGPGIVTVRLTTLSGPIAVTRFDGRVAALSVPGRPERQVALLRRPPADVLAEELRRLEPDEVYRDAVRGWSRSVAIRATTGVS
jgi:glucose-6-phosphate dehydrogenase assembly protein OpcA